MKLARLPPEVFDRITAETKMEPHTKAMARRVLVNGEAGVTVAREYDVDRRLVFQSVSIVEKAVEKHGWPKEAWVKVEYELPLDVARVFDVLVTSLRSGRAGIVEIVVKALEGARAAIARKKK